MFVVDRLGINIRKAKLSDKIPVLYWSRQPGSARAPIAKRRKTAGRLNSQASPVRSFFVKLITVGSEAPRDRGIGNECV